jgi:hypothetical protein
MVCPKVGPFTPSIFRTEAHLLLGLTSHSDLWFPDRINIILLEPGYRGYSAYEVKYLKGSLGGYLQRMHDLGPPDS